MTNELIEREPEINNESKLKTCNDLSSLVNTLGESTFTVQLVVETWKINNVEDLHSMINGCRSLVVNSQTHILKDDQPTKVCKQFSSKSLFGTFITQVCTFFDMLEFDESLLIFQSLLEFRKSTKGQIEKSRQRVVIVDDGDGDGDGEDDDPMETDKNDLFNALENQLSKIGISQRDKHTISRSKRDLESLISNQIAVLENYGTPTPLYLKRIIKMMTASSTIGSIKASDFNQLPSCYYLNYLECLSELNYNGAVDALHQYFDYMVSNNSKYFYHFALISKASLHQFFGEDHKAIDSIVEAISVARENKDNATLTYILSWFYNFMHNKPHLWKEQTLFNKSNEDQLLDFLIKKSASVNISLLAINLGFETLQIMHSGSSIGEFMASLTRTLFTAVNDIKPTFVRCAEMAASIWNTVGVTPLCRVYDDLALQYSAKSSDYISIKSRRIYLDFMRGYEREKYVEEMDKLASGISDHSLYNSIHIRSLMMHIKQYLIQGRTRMGYELMNMLLNSDIRDLELRNELSLLEIEVLIKNENYHAALEKALAITYVDDYMLLRLNILKCRIFNLSGNPYRSLSSIVQSIESCKRFGFGALLIEASLIFFEILNQLGHKKDVIRLIGEIMPHIESYGNKELREAAFYQLEIAKADEDC
ncbi:hypothetical protein KGF56_003673 [Candida oxycetoniae]|uniref:Anaphase-promoting complex subunit 5 n=1 Tax=Candida oxycetoniae TaxID=497107 RepID=A0AAI9SUW3_9ASCO|nr:uncharacterized protein KGF56_003673 [Candida oxycetoniae]KAI3403516.2 hypothetical protein KGF56_003673 [Candida oxycetoniae]